MHIAVDIDGILTIETEGHDYVNRTSNLIAIKAVNRLYNKNNTITLYTARYAIDEAVTRKWLKKHNVLFHNLVMGKLQYDILVDDRAINNFKYFNFMETSENDKLKNVLDMLQHIGEQPTRPGLQDTPKRVVKMWKEIFRGYDPDQKPNISIFKNGSDGLSYDQMIMDTGDFYSHCEHHMVPFFGQYWFGYIPDPNGGIIGLSKVARLVDYHAARLQIQERLVQDVVDDIWNALSSEEYSRPIGMGLVMEGEHLCKTMRGARKKGKMTTIKLKGAFLDNPAVKAEFLQRCMK